MGIVGERAHRTAAPSFYILHLNLSLNATSTCSKCTTPFATAFSFYLSMTVFRKFSVLDKGARPKSSRYLSSGNINDPVLLYGRPSKSNILSAGSPTRSLVVSNIVIAFSLERENRDRMSASSHSVRLRSIRSVKENLPHRMQFRNMLDLIASREGR